MNEILDGINVGFAALGGVLGWLFGGMDGFLYALIVFVICDYLTGVMAACVRKDLSSEIGFKGIARKVTIFLLVAVANIIDVDIIQTGNAVRTAVVFFYLSNEGISILENAAVIGLPIPKKLKTVLLQISEEEESNDN
ncbi:MAG: phage holin family protein [Clostridiales bacterium]|nr:phage holin family protein [Clostridiales bacterium]